METSTMETQAMERPQESVSLNAIVERDVRAGHFLVDILAGSDATAAADKYFGRQADDTMLQEAEQRGYLRGLNEAAEQRLNAPALYEQLPPSQSSPSTGGDNLSPTPDFFPEARRSIWDAE